MDIKIDEGSGVPIYRQIMEQVASMVKEGRIRPGDKLPPERELAEKIGIARGTINRAYVELKRNGVLKAVQGSGSFVSDSQDVLDDSRKGKAISMIDQLISSLEEQNFSFREIAAFINIRMMEKENLRKRVRMAAVDCNPEALDIFRNQLSYISNLDFAKILLDDIRLNPNPEGILEKYDIILTTSTHYKELYLMLPGLKGRIIQAAVSPGRQTIIDMASMPVDAPTGIICTSAKFMGIIQKTLKSFDVKMKNVDCLFDNDLKGLESFIDGIRILIIPPESILDTRPELGEHIGRFRAGGGIVIRFDYQIDRGSLIHIEEQIYDVFNKKNHPW